MFCWLQVRHFALHTLEHMLKVRWLPEKDVAAKDGAAATTTTPQSEPGQVRRRGEGRGGGGGGQDTGRREGTEGEGKRGGGGVLIMFLSCMAVIVKP